MNNKLVFLSDYIRSEPYTTSDIIAEYAKVSHHAIQQLVSAHEKDLSEFGTVAFEMRACPHKTGASMEKLYQLNEQQATLLITYLKNTEPVRRFKKALVHSFFAMREELTKREINRAALTRTHKDLAETVKLIPPHGSSAHDYSKYNGLAYIVAFGCAPSKLKRLRGADNKAPAADYLSSEEMNLIDNLKDKICNCIEMGMGYAEIKDKLTSMRIRELTREGEAG